jgi:hypothetical protein
VDAAWGTVYGNSQLLTMEVWAEEVSAEGMMAAEAAA